MEAKELIGKKAIRTAPVKFNGDRSYMREPILIIAVCNSHIKYKNLSPIFDTQKESLLGLDWLDNNWTDYDNLFALKEVKRHATVGEYVKVVCAEDVPNNEYKNGDILKIIEDDGFQARYGEGMASDRKERLLNDSEYVVLENYFPETSHSKQLSDYTNRELAAELLRRYGNDNGIGQL